MKVLFQVGIKIEFFFVIGILYIKKGHTGQGPFIN